MRKTPKIDRRDIPELTDDQIRRARRVTPKEHARFHQAYINTFGNDLPPRPQGRPAMGAMKSLDIHLRIPPDVLARVRAKANKQGIGYQTLINQILSRAA